MKIQPKYYINFLFANNTQNFVPRWISSLINKKIRIIKLLMTIFRISIIFFSILSNNSRYAKANST